MLRQVELIEKVRAYQPDMDEAMLNRAYVYATKMHGAQKRASGDPYYSHPIEVAGILTSLKLDTASIATALLHDTLEDTEATAEDISKKFGKEIFRLVDGVTKLSRLERDTQVQAQAENFRKLLVATAGDIRILLVKLADRLHNMRTLHHIKSVSKRKRIAQETLEIYAPLAGRLGMQAFREEMEELAFAETHTEAYNLLRDRLNKRGAQDKEKLKEITTEIKSVFARQRLRATITGRTKGLFSIWQKMAQKAISLEQLSDVYGLRIIVGSEADCYKALGILHRQWKCVPGRYKDYISVPKRNSYRSLHTTVMGPQQQRVEFQIRTAEMHNTAENGIAAHWLYKDKDLALAEQEEVMGPFQWLREMVDNLKQGTAEEFLEHTKLELFSDQVFCFTPGGRLIALPRGATALDFAYGVHTQIGNECEGIKVNGAAASIQRVLQNGDEVEVLRNAKQHPHPSWEAIAITGKARAAIRHSCKLRQQQEQQRLGQDILRKTFYQAKREWKRSLLERALEPLHYKTIETLLEAVGRGELSADDVLHKVYPTSRTRRFLQGAMRVLDNRTARKRAEVVPISGIGTGVSIRFAQDCFALPGDKIVGIRQADKSLMVYPLQSKRLQAMKSRRQKWVALGWKPTSQDMRFASRLVLSLANKVGSLGTITQLIAEYDINIDNLSILTRERNYYDVQIDVEVQSAKQVEDMMSALRGLREVRKVSRIIASDTPAPKATKQASAKKAPAKKGSKK